MATRVLKDTDGTEYEVEFDDDSGGGSSDAGSVLEVPEEAFEWLLKQFNEAKETERRSTSSGQQNPPAATSAAGKILKIVAKQASAGSSSQNTKPARRKVLKLRQSA